MVIRNCANREVLIDRQNLYDNPVRSLKGNVQRPTKTRLYEKYDNWK